MKQIIVILALAFIFLAWNNNASAQKPCVSFSFDDGSIKDRHTYKNSEWNAMIRKQLKDNKLHAVWFVAGRIMDCNEGKQLLRKWDEDGHIIANHTYNHYNYNDSLMTCEKFVKDIQKCDSLISGYENFKRIFRFPYLIRRQYYC